MKKLLLRALLVLLAGSTTPGLAQASDYVFSQSMQTFSVPTSGLLGPIGLPLSTPALFPMAWDDPTVNVTFPFPINFNGQVFNGGQLTANGYLAIGDNYILPFYYDLYSRTGPSITATRANGSNLLTGASSRDADFR